jgi:hypothetical protein
MRSEEDKAGEALLSKWMNDGTSIKLWADVCSVGITVQVVGKVTNWLGGILLIKGDGSEVTVKFSGTGFELRGESLAVPLRTGGVAGGSCLLTPVETVEA